MSTEKICCSSGFSYPHIRQGMCVFIYCFEGHGGDFLNKKSRDLSNHGTHFS